MQALSFLLLSVVAFALWGCGGESKNQTSQVNATPQTPDEWADHAQGVHGLEAWWKQEVVVMDMDVDFGGNRIVDGVFTFQAHGPEAKYEAPEGVVVYDGSEAYMKADSDWSRARFHVLTWPWFLMAPLKISGDGITLSDPQRITLRGVDYVTFKQTFASDMGDSPDDWYRYFINPVTGQVEALAYIVTFGKGDDAEANPSIVFYKGVQDFDGVQLATQYEFWYWDSDAHKLVGNAPKGTATVHSVIFQQLEKTDFSIPEGAKLQAIPGN